MRQGWNWRAGPIPYYLSLNFDNHFHIPPLFDNSIGLFGGTDNHFQGITQIFVVWMILRCESNNVLRMGRWVEFWLDRMSGTFRNESYMIILWMGRYNKVKRSVDFWLSFVLFWWGGSLAKFHWRKTRPVQRQTPEILWFGTIPCKFVELLHSFRYIENITDVKSRTEKNKKCS